MLSPEQISEATTIAAEILGKAHFDAMRAASAGDRSHMALSISVVFFVDPKGKLIGKAVLMDPDAPRQLIGRELMKLGLNLSDSPMAALVETGTISERLVEVTVGGRRKDGTP